MNKLYIWILTLLSVGGTQAQITFERTYDSFYDLNPKWVHQYKQDYYVMSSYHFDYVALNKFDSVGNLIYTHDFGFAGTNFYKDGIRTQDRGFVIAGNTFGDPDNLNGQSPYVIKLNEQGLQEWRKAYQLQAGGEVMDEGKSIVEIPSGGYFLVSKYGNKTVSPQNQDIVLRKLDTQGNIIWTKIIGGLEDELPYDIIRTQSGDYLIGGATMEEQLCNGTLESTLIPFILKIDEEGEVIWEKRIDSQYLPCTKGGAEELIEYETGKYLFNSNYAEFMTVAFDDWGNIIHLERGSSALLATRFVLHPTTGDLYGFTRDGNRVNHFDSDLSVIRTWNYINPLVSLRGMSISPQGEFLLTGVKNDSLCLIKTDCEGNVLNPVFCTTPISQAAMPTFTMSTSPDSWQIHYTANEAYTLCVYNALGQTMTTAPLRQPATSYTIVNDHYAQGVYYFSITDAQGKQIFTQKALKY